MILPPPPPMIYTLPSVMGDVGTILAYNKEFQSLGWVFVVNFSEEKFKKNLIVPSAEAITDTEGANATRYRIPNVKKK